MCVFVSVCLRLSVSVFLGLHISVKSIKKHARENGSFWGVRLVVLGLWWGPEGSERWELPFPQVNELGLSKKKCLG